MRLKNGAKYDSLNPKEKRRLRRLREKVRKRDLKRKLRERKKMTRLNGRKKGTVMAMALAKIAAKTQKKLQQTHLFNKKHNQEHCYAAAPESPKKQYPEELQDITIAAATPDILVDDHPPVKVVIEAVQSVPLLQIKVDTDVEVLAPTEDDAEMAPVVVDDLQPPSDSDQPPEAELKEELEKAEPAETVPEPAAEKTAVPKSQSSAVARRVKRPPLAVLHRDAVQRLSQRSRWQDGQLHLDAFTDRQAACISCTTCSELLTVKRFMKHMHHQKNRDELAHVTLTQTLEMRAPEAASSEDHATWSDFKKRQAELMGPPSPAPAAPRRVRPGPPKLKAPAVRAKAVGRPALKPHQTRTVAKHPAGSVTPNGTVNTGSSVVSSQTVAASTTAPSITSNTPSSTSPSTPQRAAPTAAAAAPSSPQLRGAQPSPALTPVGKASSLRRHSAASTLPPPSPHTAAPTRARTVGLVHTPPHSNLQTDTSTTTPASSIRHSTRVRKQKQLHPIERYVFSGGISPPTPEPPAKRQRLSSSSSGEQVASSSAAAAAPVRKVRLRLSTATTGVKYDLRANPETTARQ